ncbi:MAG: hypothetical protein ACRDGM_07075 [bacterium]
MGPSRKSRIGAVELGRFGVEAWAKIRANGLWEPVEQLIAGNAGGLQQMAPVEQGILDLFCIALRFKSKTYGEDAIRALVDSYYDALKMPEQERAYWEGVINYRFSEYHESFRSFPSGIELPNKAAAYIATDPTLEVVLAVKAHILAILMSWSDTLQEIENEYEIT